MPVTRTHVQTTGATFVETGDRRSNFVQAVNTGRMFEVADISGSSFMINPHQVVAILVREDPQ